MRMPYRSFLVLGAIVGMSACSGGTNSSVPALGPAAAGPASQTRTALSVGGPTCNVPADYPTIQAAANVAACTTIRVAPGTYNENVSIAHTLTLRGAQAGADARTPRGAESVINGGVGPNITITANGVAVDGFTLNGPVSQGTAAIVMMGGNAGETIKNNIVNNPGRAASFNTSNTIFYQNLVNATATAGDGFQANTSPVQNVAIASNTFRGATAAIYNADITIIEGNSNIAVLGNQSTGDGTLIALFKTNGAAVVGNTIIGDPSASAIYIGGGDTSITVDGNTVRSAGSAVNVANAFGVGPNLSVTITRNTLRNNTDGVKVGAAAVTSASTIVAHRNGLTGNSGFGVDNLSSVTVNATCNWWGARNGPGPVGPGSGDKVTTNVTYAPWLTSSNLSSSCGGSRDNDGGGGDGGGDDGGGDKHDRN